MKNLSFYFRSRKGGLNSGVIALVVMLAFVACIFALGLAASASAAEPANTAENMVSAFVATFVVCALLAPRCTGGVCYTVTLILPLIIKKLMTAYKQKNPLLKYFAFDLSDERIKFNQEIIAQMPLIPTATPHTPGADLTTGAQNVKDLIGDVPMKIDRAVKVVLKVPTADAVSLELNATFNEAIENAGNAIASYVIGSALGQVNPATITHQIVEAAADVDRDTLSKARIQLNVQKAMAPRFGLVSSASMSTLTADPRIASGDYHGKLVGENPYVTLENLEGFKAITEFTQFPDDAAVAAFAADAASDLITLANHGLGDGSRVRVANAGGALPAGLAAATDYFVRDVGNSDTFKLSATLGGAAINITDAGTGVHTLSRYDHLTGFFFAMPAMLIAVRGLNDNIDLAKSLGIPVPILHETKSDPDTGLTMHAYMWIDVKTHDIYVAVVMAFGVRVGRQVSTNAADSLTDRSGLRLVSS